MMEFDERWQRAMKLRSEGEDEGEDEGERGNSNKSAVIDFGSVEQIARKHGLSQFPSASISKEEPISIFK